MKTFDFHAAIPRVATRTKKFTPLLNTSVKVTNLPAVELLRMLLPHYMKTMSDGGILKKRIPSLIQVLQPELYTILISKACHYGLPLVLLLHLYVVLFSVQMIRS